MIILYYNNTDTNTTSTTTNTNYNNNYNNNNCNLKRQMLYVDVYNYLYVCFCLNMHVLNRTSAAWAHTLDTEGAYIFAKNRYCVFYPTNKN